MRGPANLMGDFFALNSTHFFVAPGHFRSTIFTGIHFGVAQRAATRASFFRARGTHTLCLPRVLKKARLSRAVFASPAESPRLAGKDGKAPQNSPRRHLLDRRHPASGRIGIDENHFLHLLRSSARRPRSVIRMLLTLTPVTIGCRAVKSPHEIGGSCASLAKLLAMSSRAGLWRHCKQVCRKTKWASLWNQVSQKSVCRGRCHSFSSGASGGPFPTERSKPQSLKRLAK